MREDFGTIAVILVGALAVALGSFGYGLNHSTERWCTQANAHRHKASYDACWCTDTRGKAWRVFDAKPK